MQPGSQSPGPHPPGVTDGFTIVWQNLTGPSEDGFEYEVKLQ